MSEAERNVYALILESLGRIEKLTKDDSAHRDEIRALRLCYLQRIDRELSKIRVALEVLGGKPTS